MARKKRTYDEKIKLWTKFFIGWMCWPIEAAFAMWGLALLHHEGFNLPRPGYVNAFWVVVGGELLVASVTMTRECRKAVDK